ncbi:hypothetical protein M622_13630 [Thauera terpenica 58Eu]|uniref:VWFA domain-containing protein n=1 Tax=Thauera terpenica 58Eu TaxID=1348657 RepID=T0ATU3_9RHOO|nr:VWA domain-containing protein [Thauera terpenica]EPZ16264.1 hypothetical protein M622_13630 [Thauera terpenica 58Eu]
MEPAQRDTHPLRLLAAAVVGRPVAISYLVDPAAPAWTDGERVFLSLERRGGEDARELLVQCALLAGQALHGMGLPALVGSIEQRQRYLLLEVERCARLIADRLPAPFLGELDAYRTGQCPASAEESLRIARGMTRLPRPPAWYGTLKPWSVLRRNARGGGRAMDAGKLDQLESQLSTVEPENIEQDEDALTRNPFWKLLSSPLGKDGFFSRFMREIFDMQSSPDGESAKSGVEGSSEMVSGRASSRIGDIRQALRTSLALAIPSAMLANEEGAHCYPEWDASQRRYRSNWTNVEEVAPGSEEPAFDTAILDGPAEIGFQRALATLCLGFRRHSGQPQGDGLVLDPMIRLAVDLRTGHSGDERIYSASLRTRRDLGVMVLLDTSSSTLECLGADRVFDRQARLAWQLVRSFELLGDRVALYGFHSWGRRLVRFQHVKAFDERLGGGSREPMAQLSVAGYTRCGAAIRHGVEMIDKRAGTPFKLLVLVSDGYPHDDQYEGDYAAADTRKALDEAAARGVACVCLSVGSDAESERLAAAYGSANYMSVANTTDLLIRLRGVMEHALAATTRRTAPGRAA